MGEAVEVGTGELPLEWGGDLFVATAEGEQLLLERVEVGEVVGGEDLGLNDREVDLGLVVPVGGTGDMNGTIPSAGAQYVKTRVPGRTPEQTTKFLALAHVSGGKPPAGHLTRRQAQDALADILTEERHKVGQRAYDHLGARSPTLPPDTCITSSMSAAASAPPSATIADR